MKRDEALNKIYGILNSINAIAGYFLYNDYKEYAQILFSAQELIQEGIDEMEIKECSCCGEKTDEKRLEIFDYVFCEKCAERYRATTRRFVKKFCNNKVDERLKIDWDKVCALANAGWDYKQIAEEVGCCPGTIRNQLQDRLMDYNVHGVRFTKHSILEDN